MAKHALLLVAIVATAATGCAFKTGPVRAANYDYNEYESYDQPHAQPPSREALSWDAGLTASAPAAPPVEAE